MFMRVITWNINGANEKSRVWNYLLSELKPDVALLQEVGRNHEEIEEIKEAFNVKSKRATCEKGEDQTFYTAILVKGEIVEELRLSSEYPWVNDELEFFKGNLLAYRVKIGDLLINVVSVHSPAWSIDKKRLTGVDTSPVRLKSKRSRIWATEILWSALSNKNTFSDNEKWIVGGDFNSSETFDPEWQDKNRELLEKKGIKNIFRSGGNKEIIDRMYALGFRECLRESNNGKPVPTYKNKYPNAYVIHQMDHLYVRNLPGFNCRVGDQSIIIGKSPLSDHLPIIADFNEN
jgi:exonuclease III